MKPSPARSGVKVLNQGAFLNQVEFSNNGALDSLTGAPAPKVFFDNLAREISKSKRKFQAVSIVMVQVLPDFVLVPDKALGTISKNKNETDANLHGSAYEKELISVGRCLKSSMRGGDFYSRIADNGFWICLQGDSVDAEKAVKRFALKISEAKILENKLQRKLAGRNHLREEKNSLDHGHSINKYRSLDTERSLIENQRARFVVCEWDGEMNEVEWIQKIDLLYFNS
ncbi:unannotated protein [freshwater metagenome]|uniref:Unannotated protein n=1 Tax=freshwater metagenome TaxID=449393 RepID=A0A6J6THD6_9ZZZZ|nr:hypothetical protein [Actinomycetota bacterium]